MGKTAQGHEMEVWAEEHRKTPATTLPCITTHSICHHKVFCHQVWRKFHVVRLLMSIKEDLDFMPNFVIQFQNYITILFFGITIMYYGVSKYGEVAYNRIIFCVTKTIKSKIPRKKHRE
jgi:hypothetical protein